MGSVAALGLLRLGLVSRDAQHKLIRPPGALEENAFQDRCIRCMECVRICESNGGCLQPAPVRGNVLELWLPVAVMREGYCEYNCNLCSQVCPTQAIVPLTVAEKQKVPIGLAYFDKDLCIPYANNSDCIVCEEHCPTPDKAIKFDVKEVRLPNGSARRVKYPYVVKELCIGCGICETKCPLPGQAGVFVTTANQRRWSPDGALPAAPAATPDPYG
jgi:ferredoxin